MVGLLVCVYVIAVCAGKCLWQPAMDSMDEPAKPPSAQLGSGSLVSGDGSFHSLVQRTLGSMMKLNWGNFSSRWSWMRMMMSPMIMMMRTMRVSIIMTMLMAAINNVIHKHQQAAVGLLGLVGRFGSAAAAGLNPILVLLSQPVAGLVWDFNFLYLNFFCLCVVFSSSLQTKANVNFSTLPFGLFKNLNLSFVWLGAGPGAWGLGGCWCCRRRGGGFMVVLSSYLGPQLVCCSCSKI